MAAALPFLPFIAMGAQAIGAIHQGNVNAANAENQANMARYNSQVAANQAEQARQVSTAEQLAQQRKARATLGMTSAAIAQSGTGFGGTNKDILDQTQTLSELDQLNLAYDGALKAQGYATQGEIDQFQARIYDSNADSARTAGYLNAVTSVLTGASSMYGGGGGTTKAFSTPGTLGTGLKLGSRGLGLQYGRG